MATKNIVLVHGAWADGSSWSRVIPLLEDKGFYVSAVQLPLTSLEDDIQVTRNMLAMQKSPSVLVGHSYGGAVITGAANGGSDVSALVYVAAFGLEEGESLEELGRQARRHLVRRKCAPMRMDSSGLTGGALLKYSRET